MQTLSGQKFLCGGPLVTETDQLTSYPHNGREGFRPLTRDANERRLRRSEDLFQASLLGISLRTWIGSRLLILGEDKQTKRGQFQRLNLDMHRGVIVS